jgi:uncharacterized protein YqeY
MSMNDQVGADITAAMKARDASRLSALRMLKAAVMNKSVEKVATSTMRKCCRSWRRS